VSSALLITLLTTWTRNCRSEQRRTSNSINNQGPSRGPIHWWRRKYRNQPPEPNAINKHQIRSPSYVATNGRRIYADLVNRQQRLNLHPIREVRNLAEALFRLERGRTPQDIYAVLLALGVLL
jgi:hypothetical protein